MISGVLRLNSKIKYGMTSRNVPIYLFNPLDRKYSDCIVGCSKKDVTSNVLALVNVDHWETDKLTRGTLVKVLGNCGEMEAEETALFYQYCGPSWKHFDTSSIITPSFDCYETVHGFTFNVDPEGCIDIDDTVTIGDDGYMYITIADVASWMNVNPHIFNTAYKIGQTLYKRGKVVSPLIPIEKECSLLPNETRHGIALKFKWSNKTISDISFQKVEIVNNKSFTYDSIYKSEYSTILKELSSALVGYELTDSHDWIEQLMIFYNTECAKRLIETKTGLLRTQDEPDIEKLKTYSRLGPDVEFLANKSAYYVNASSPKKHWGFNDNYYCHATSPIRRFADIVNQMVLADYPLYPFDIAMINERNQCLKKYERDMFFLFQVLNSKKREIDGIVLSGHRIWVPEWKRIVTCKNNSNAGEHGLLKYSVDMNQPTWKKRMVFRFESLNT